MSISSYEEIYEIIKKHGPISLYGIGEILQDMGRVDHEGWRLRAHSEIAGYISNLSQEKLIKDVGKPQSAIRKTPPQKIWKAT